MKAVKYILTIGVSTILFASAIFAIGYVGLRDKHNITMTNSVDLTGTWHQSDDGEMRMTADISNGHIEIMLHSNAISGLYWGGSFLPGDTTRSTFDITSNADEIGLSQNPTKIFKYKDGQLSYEFTMLGKTRLIHLTR